ncbi:CopD family protein [Paenibacillus sp. OSY-SE]|uniref:CopD family protein n=1 Tax=Paenibacillus sp. OSY-SE TaxID=1196323 RepID=UPI00031518D8|nr:CopD family protein [Paenibacillus sp. OSY-SE]
MTMLNKAAKLALLFLIFLIPFVLLPQPASAHANMASSSPLSNSELTDSPTEIRITYTEGIDADLSSMTLWNTDGAEIAGEVKSDGEKTLVKSISSLPNGIYKVKWQVLSVDTHVTEGSFEFAVGVKLKQSGPAATKSLDDDEPASATENKTTTPAKPEKNGSTNGTKHADSSANQPVNKDSGKGKPNSQPESPQSGGASKVDKTAAGTTGQKENPPSTESQFKAEQKVSDPPRQEKRDDTSEPDSAAQSGKEKEAALAAPDASPQAGAGEKDQSGAAAPASPVQAEKAPAGAGNEANPDQGEVDHSHHHDHGAEAAASASEAAADHADHNHGNGNLDGWNALIRIINIVVTVLLFAILYYRMMLADGVNERFPAFHRAMKRLCKGITISAVILFAATYAAHMLLIAQQLSSGRADTSAASTALTLALSTRVGLADGARVLLAALLALMMLFKNGATVLNKVVQLLILLGIALTFPLTGHAVASDSGLLSFLTVVSHTLHIVTASIWFGGLLGMGMLTASWRRNQLGAEHVHEINGQWRRFSRAALPLTVLTVVTGIILAAMRLGTWSAFISSSYGQILLVKSGLFLLILIIAAFHRYYWLPRFAKHSGEAHLLRQFLIGVQVEIAVGIAVFIVAGMLSTSPPPGM